MRLRITLIALLVVAAAAVAVVGVLVGRASVSTAAATQKGYRTGHLDGYVDGVRVGQTQGREEGRALQVGDALPAADRKAVRDAFTKGYAAGTNDAFAGYDGGWQLGAPYVIVVEQAGGAITYRIRSREPLKPGIDYYLCPDGHSLCQASHR
jgi:hypothetical protein